VVGVAVGALAARLAVTQSMTDARLGRPDPPVLFGSILAAAAAARDLLAASLQLGSRVARRRSRCSGASNERRRTRPL
jgi:hypothetical protein